LPTASFHSTGVHRNRVTFDIFADLLFVTGQDNDIPTLIVFFNFIS